MVGPLLLWSLANVSRRRMQCSRCLVWGSRMMREGIRRSVGPPQSPSEKTAGSAGWNTVELLNHVELQPNGHVVQFTSRETGAGWLALTPHPDRSPPGIARSPQALSPVHAKPTSA
ncbi:hypothetical protein SKAU_G00043840 [Synaphobranchus kaupii]|uniref:Uncharacterized protein n=1 Tax=Synaphobranchus kaupii TaxID=118154 RepID=A0A9Q1G1P6_SYNKA|nr:hypothetical protein SKAU_G00043840 [Synaphobranchus kaupii]